MKSVCLFVLTVGSCAAFQAPPQPAAGPNVKASYPAGAESRRVITRTIEFDYAEREFTPPLRVGGPAAGADVFDTPEHVMDYRSRAMAVGDYDKWLATWDDDAKQLFTEEYKTPGRLENQKHLWSAAFSVGQMTLFKRIETRSYVILTYRVTNAQGQDIGRLELPSIFRKIGNKWLGTQDLSADLLLAESPWMTGKSSVQREVK